MTDNLPTRPRARRGMFVLLGGFILLAAFMYGSLLFKIIKYGR